MQAFAEALIKILAELIALSLMQLLWRGRLTSIDKNVRGMRRDLRRTRNDVGYCHRRLDAHDDHAGIDTKGA